MGRHLNIQLARCHTVDLTDLPQSTASGTHQVVESTGQGEGLHLFLTQFNPTSEIVEAGERFAVPLFNNPGGCLGTDAGDVREAEPDRGSGVSPMATVITSGIKRTDLGLLVVMKAVVRPRLDTTVTGTQQFHVSSY